MRGCASSMPMVTSWTSSRVFEFKASAAAPCTASSACCCCCCCCYRWQKVPTAQQLPPAAAHMAFAPQAARCPRRQGRPAGMRRWPVHESSAVEGSVASPVRPVPPDEAGPAGGAGRRCRGTARPCSPWALRRPRRRPPLLPMPGSDVPPHCAQGLRSVPAGQLVGAIHTVLFSLCFNTRLPSPHRLQGR